MLRSLSNNLAPRLCSAVQTDAVLLQRSIEQQSCAQDYYAQARVLCNSLLAQSMNALLRVVRIASALHWRLFAIPYPPPGATPLAFFDLLEGNFRLVGINRPLNAEPSAASTSDPRLHTMKIQLELIVNRSVRELLENLMATLDDVVNAQAALSAKVDSAVALIQSLQASAGTLTPAQQAQIDSVNVGLTTDASKLSAVIPPTP